MLKSVKEFLFNIIDFILPLRSDFAIVKKLDEKTINNLKNKKQSKRQNEEKRQKRKGKKQKVDATPRSTVVPARVLMGSIGLDFKVRMGTKCLAWTFSWWFRVGEGLRV